VLDEGADLAAAVSDMRALAALTAGALDPAAFDGVDAVVLDTNLPADTIAEAARRAGEAPIVLDPVSVAKAHAALPVLGCLTALKANLREAETLSGVTGAEGAAQRLLEAGVAQVFITMGPAGVVCADRSGIFTLMAPDVTVANATGAGDAFTAGVAWGLGTGADLGRTAAMASALSAIALESESTVSEHVSAAAVAERMEGASR
jgi:pseudouridine kinase